MRFGSFLERVLWAIRLRSDQVLFSDYIKPDSQVLMYRGVKTRVNKIAPWLEYDKDPYPAIVDGRILWILDAYTSSDHFPYSQPLPRRHQLPSRLSQGHSRCVHGRDPLLRQRGRSDP